MRIPLLLTIGKSRPHHGISMRHFYSIAGISRQGFFQAVRDANEEKALWENLPGLVNAYRAEKDARAGSRSLYFNLDIKSRFDVGITRFEQKMSELGLTLPVLKSRIVTTRSVLQSWNYPNLANGLTITGINQLVVGDITYVRQQLCWSYLFCLTDVYSSRIVGWHYGETMSTHDALNCLLQWEKLRGKEALHGCIHHSDGGGQYFSRFYLGKLTELNLQVSRAENCMQNGYAEQINGLVKNHLIPNIRGKTTAAIRRELSRLIHLYNHERKQERLQWKSPAEYEQYLMTRNNDCPLKLYTFDPK